MKVTVTGAAGRLGSEVVKHLVEKGYEVSATDKSWRMDLPVRLQIADLLQPISLYPILEGSEALVHLGNHPSFWGRDSQRIFNENTQMNMNAFQAAKEVGVKKIFFASSIQCISGPWSWWDESKRESQLPYLPLDGLVPPNPGNPYGLSKQAGEVLLAYFAKQEGLTCRAARFPLLASPEMLERMGRRGYKGDNIDEAFSFLPFKDAASLIEAFLRTPLEGFRVWFPASKENRLKKPVSELISEYFPKVPLRKPLAEIESLVDASGIEAELDWKAP